MTQRWWLLLSVIVPGAAAGQGGLEEAARQARDAWVAHDPDRLLQGSPGVVLQIPGADPSSAIGRGQAGELLARYLRTAVERGTDILVAREIQAGRGYVELARRFSIAGTSEERRETVFLGLRRRGDAWVVVELRTGP